MGLILPPHPTSGLCTSQIGKKKKKAKVPRLAHSTHPQDYVTQLIFFFFFFLEGESLRRREKKEDNIVMQRKYHIV